MQLFYHVIQGLFGLSIAALGILFLCVGVNTALNAFAPY